MSNSKISLNTEHTLPVLTGLDFEKDDELSFYLPAMYLYNDNNIKLNGKNPFKILTIRKSPNPNLSSYFDILLEVSLKTIVDSREHSFTAELLCDICLASNEFTIGLPSELTNQNTLKSHTVGLMYILNKPHNSFHKPIDESFNNAIHDIIQDLITHGGETSLLVNQVY